MPCRASPNPHPLLLSWSSCHHLISFPALKTFPQADLPFPAYLCPLASTPSGINHSRKTEESPAFAFQPFHIRHQETHTLCLCMHTHVQTCVIPPHHPLKLKRRELIADLVKTSQATALETALNSALKTHSEQQMHLRCVGNRLFDRDTCYPQFPFLPAFHWKRKDTREQWASFISFLQAFYSFPFMAITVPPLGGF